MALNIARNPAVGVVAVVVIAVVWVWILKPADRAGGEGVYFFDLGSRQLYVGSHTMIPPMAAPSGASGVRARVFACGQCTDENRFIGFLERYTDEAHAALTDGSAPMKPQLIAEGQQVTTEAAETWVVRISPQGEALIQSVQSRCPDPTSLTVCEP